VNPGSRWVYRPSTPFRLGPQGPLPTAVKRLIIANVGVFVVQLATGTWLTRNFGLIPALVTDLELWRLFTYQFLHGGVFHLALNMLMLWMFGSELEHRWGHRFFTKYYFVCAVGGGIAFTLVQWGEWVTSVGASGAIYGVLMAYAMWFPNRQVYLYFLFPIRVRYLVIFLILLELVQAIDATGTVAHTAHLGGMAFGYGYLRWYGMRGLETFAISQPADLRKAYMRWKLKRLQKRRFGQGPTGPTYH